MPARKHLDPARQAQLLALVDGILGDHLGTERAAALTAELHGRADARGEGLLWGVNPAREDADGSWDAARAAAYVPMEGTGAVHLELGTWSAFDDARVAELVAGDGLAEFIRLDADPQYRCEVVADATALPFASGSIDRVASNSVLEHIAYPHEVLRESLRVLRPGGVMVVVMPFVIHQHGYPDDYVRLSPGFFERVCPELGFVDVRVETDTSGGLYNVLHNASKMATVDAAGDAAEAEALRALRELVSTLTGLLVPLDRGFEDASRSWFHSVRVLARAPGTWTPPTRARGDRSRPFAERAHDLLADPAIHQSLRRDGSRLVCDLTNLGYAVSREGFVNFLEPTTAPPSLAVKLRRAARR